MHNSIEVTGLGKRYTVGGRGGAMLLTELIANRMRGRSRVKGAEFWALQDVSFTVEHGQLVGIIGRNGAGKTTLLRILARITAPTVGVARVRGRLGALLDVGTGFHDELTGRENVFLGGTILGRSRSDVRTRFDQIAAFSGVEHFLDTPLKRYSAGMRLRLAFAVAAHLEPEVLVIDEALAVGDAEFQRRCIGRMEDLQRSGRTVVFVSHDLGAIGRLCDRTLWLDQGEVAFDGPTHESIRRYFDAIGRIDAGRVDLEPDPHLPAALTSVWITDEEGAPITEPTRHAAIVLRLRVAVRQRIPGLDVGFYVTDSTGTRVLEDTLRVADPGSELGSAPNDAEVGVTLPGVLRPDDYLVGIYIYAGQDYFVVEEPLRFRVPPAQGESDDGIRPAVRPRLTWSVVTSP